MPISVLSTLPVLTDLIPTVFLGAERGGPLPRSPRRGGTTAGAHSRRGELLQVVDPGWQCRVAGIAHTFDPHNNSVERVTHIVPLFQMGNADAKAAK